MRRTVYVWSGSLRGVEIPDSASAYDAVDRAVRDNLPCVLNAAIRISVQAKGAHPLDVYFEAPYEDLFPDLFDGSLDVKVASVEGEIDG
jgi:hypothetical protein